MRPLASLYLALYMPEPRASCLQEHTMWHCYLLVPLLLLLLLLLRLLSLLCVCYCDGAAPAAELEHLLKH